MFNNKDEINDSIDEILDVIDSCQEDKAKIIQIRYDIIGLIHQTITFLDQANEFGLWEKDSIASSISFLYLNIYKRNTTTSWLRICMTNLHLALTDSTKRSPLYSHNSKKSDEIDKLKLSDYKDALNDLRQYINSHQ